MVWWSLKCCLYLRALWLMRRARITNTLIHKGGVHYKELARGGLCAAAEIGCYERQACTTAAAPRSQAAARRNNHMSNLTGAKLVTLAAALRRSYLTNSDHAERDTDFADAV
jgi:hypothetical protein